MSFKPQVTSSLRYDNVTMLHVFICRSFPFFLQYKNSLCTKVQYSIQRHFELEMHIVPKAHIALKLHFPKSVYCTKSAQGTLY